MAKRKKEVVETDAEKKMREMVEEIAGNIGRLADAVGSLINGPLNKKALIILLASSSRVPQNAVKDVLEALQNLRKDWLNK